MRLRRWLSSAEILAASGVSLLLIFPVPLTTLTGIGLVVLLGIWLLRWRVEREPLPSTPLNLALLFLLFSVLVSVLVSAVPPFTTEALSYFLAGQVLFWAMVRWASTPGDSKVAWVWGALTVSGLALAVLAPFGMTLSAPPLLPLPSVYARLAGRLPESINANVLAGALVVLWPVALSLPRIGDSRAIACGLRTFACGSAAFMVLTIVITQSRGAYLAVIAEVLLLFVLRWPRSVWVLIPIVLIIAMILIGVVGLDTLLDELTTGSVTSGLEQRIEIWSRALYAIQDFPFTGVGLGTFEQVMAVLYPLFLNLAGTVPHAHNLFLQVAVDLGLPGLIAYLSLLGLTFFSGFFAHRIFISKGNAALSNLCAGCIVALTGMCVHGLVDAASWGYIKLAFIPWLVIGLLVSLYRLAEREHKESTVLPEAM